MIWDADKMVNEKEKKNHNWNIDIDISEDKYLFCKHLQSGQAWCTREEWIKWQPIMLQNISAVVDCLQIY